jgi:co-chaperonin GroES (HSP10)
MANTSGLQPLGRAVLLRHYEPERTQGVIVIPDNVKDRTLMVEQRAEVIELGPNCYPDEPPRCKPGDRVLISRMAGYLATGPADGQRYVMVNDRDIFARIVEDQNHG